MMSQRKWKISGGPQPYLFNITDPDGNERREFTELEISVDRDGARLKLTLVEFQIDAEIWDQMTEVEREQVRIAMPDEEPTP